MKCSTQIGILMKAVLKTFTLASLLTSFTVSASTGWIITDNGVIGSPQVKQGGVTAVSSFEKGDGDLVFSVIMVTDNNADDVGIKMIEVDSPIMVNGKKIVMQAQLQGQMKSYNPKTKAETQYILNEFKTKDGVTIENLTYSTAGFNKAFHELK